MCRESFVDFNVQPKKNFNGQITIHEDLLKIQHYIC